MLIGLFVTAYHLSVKSLVVIKWRAVVASELVGEILATDVFCYVGRYESISNASTLHVLCHLYGLQALYI